MAIMVILASIGVGVFMASAIDDCLKDFSAKGKVAFVATIIAILAWANCAYASELTSDNVLNAVNAYRIEQGLSKLEYSNELQQAANIRAIEAGEVWSHIRPDGSPWYSVDDRTYGENLGKGYTTAEDLVAAWIASPTHQANLINSGFKTMSLGISGTFVAQEFGI